MRKLFFQLSLILALLAPVAVPALASAACPSPKSGGDAKNQVLIGVGETDKNCDGSGVTDFVATIVDIISLIIGVAAIIVIIISGFKYITSGGDSSKVSSAKSTLIYALVGVAIAAVAQLLVHFVLFQASNV